MVHAMEAKVEPTHCIVKSTGFGVRSIWVQALVLSFSTSMILGSLLNLWMPLFPHLHKMISFLIGAGLFPSPSPTFILLLTFWESLYFLTLLSLCPLVKHRCYQSGSLISVEITAYSILRVHSGRAKEIWVSSTTLRLRRKASLRYELHLEELGLQYPVEINLTSDR